MHYAHQGMPASVCSNDMLILPNTTFHEKMEEKRGRYRSKRRMYALCMHVYPYQ